MPADRDLAVFYRSFAEMLRAGVVVSGALESCAHILPEAGAAAQLVERGQPVSVAFAHFPKTFPADHVRLIHIAEQSGRLDTTVNDLADYAAEMIAARRTLVSGLALPALIIHIAAFITPVPALVLGHATFGEYLLAVLEPLAVLWGLVGAFVWFTRHASAATLDRLLQRVPVVADTWRELQYWRMASTLHMLSRTSLDVPSSLRFAATVVSSAQLTQALEHAATTTERSGSPASVALQATGALPTDVIALWRNAEITGGLDAMFARLSARYAESFRQRVQTLATWLPRLAYFIVAFGAVFHVLQLAGPYLRHINDAAR
jgi:type II secretory pathway component PulF